ncbi:hypothetical protein IAQ61_004030 [Plenodomus lingam]|uniref:Pentatricopeptide repeat protein n=1 Tax=Leptosphaeria maculans (strain JN3 / isolate v23.1.3 / race Av1-4-5-6-7-8) TaxID=985895 RepID=E4ZWZ2_LEPMJ|nr:hypothetical protein LEMA_P023540.1 [Plenodomus lingam JN3]KAH9873407.1 hypothetical protein IAQ61_004030 [Plenodomus lingam]CBX95202.1 hypothetical protein LEMA_P023540.1 [Plenodomus lingam JN3]
MLRLPKLQWQLHSPRSTQLRTLRTGAEPIPKYIKVWNPAHVPESSSPQDVRISNVTNKASNSLGPSKSAVEAYSRGVGPGVRRVPLDQHCIPPLSLVLKAASSGPSPRSFYRVLWLAYQNARKTDPERLRRMRTHWWSLTWTVLKSGIEAAVGEESIQHRARLDELENDMRLFKIRLSYAVRSQQLMDMFVARREEKLAIREWEADHQTFLDSARQIFPAEHLEVGAKLFSLTGDLGRSLQLMDQLLNAYPGWDSSIIMHVFRAHASSKAGHDHKVAKILYSRLKERRGKNMNMDDYTSCFVGFLEARHLPYAQLVFQDMYNDIQLSGTSNVEMAKEVLTKLHMLYRLGTDISKTTSIALAALSTLPRVYHDHIFGDWIKAAVVYKAPEAAGQILDMMYDHGTQPRTFHFNMLLKTLFRTGERSDILKAENIGWQMIEETRKAHKKKARQTPDATKDVVRKTPVADVTTFALIIHHHALVSQWEHVDYLVRQLQEASIFPNANMMNVLIDNKCRQGFFADAWGIYKFLTRPPEGENGVFPDGATFRHLWKTLRLALGDQATRDDSDLPSPVELLKEMVHWWRATRRRPDAPEFLQGLAGSDKGAALNLILHCFSYKQDLVGSLVALHAMRQYFGLMPSYDATNIVHRQLAWIDMSHEPESISSQGSLSRSYTRRIKRILKIYHVLVQQRAMRLDLGTKGLKGLNDTEIADVRLNALSELVRVLLKRIYAPEVVEEMIEATKMAVGLPDLPTGDMTAWEVA